LKSTVDAEKMNSKETRKTMKKEIKKIFTDKYSFSSIFNIFIIDTTSLQVAIKPAMLLSSSKNSDSELSYCQLPLSCKISINFANKNFIPTSLSSLCYLILIFILASFHFLSF
jgi:hypothetical protein